ncbi:MAG: hypothetical protein SXV54_19995 [Chloroflexota bacterium]|nr:hypothetical protein [Chloroflexota bacterium]
MRKAINVVLLSLVSLFGVVILLWGFLWVQLLVLFPPEHVYLSATSPDGTKVAHFSVKYRGCLHPRVPTDIEPHCYVTVVGTRHGEIIVRETEHRGTLENTFAELAKKHAPWAVDPIISLEWENSP